MMMLREWIRRFSCSVDIKMLNLGASLMRRSVIGSYRLLAPSLHDNIASVDILSIWDVERDLLSYSDAYIA
jgi:hypothetical protein